MATDIIYNYCHFKMVLKIMLKMILVLMIVVIVTMKHF